MSGFALRPGPGDVSPKPVTGDLNTHAHFCSDLEDRDTAARGQGVPESASLVEARAETGQESAAQHARPQAHAGQDRAEDAPPEDGGGRASGKNARGRGRSPDVPGVDP